MLTLQFLSNSRQRLPGQLMSKEIIRLSCGGDVVVVTASLLRRAPPRMQQLLQQTPDMDGLIQIDRDHTYFAPLIHYLRTGHVALDRNVSAHGVVAEAACVALN
jgi:hypothetical protein